MKNILVLFIKKVHQDNILTADIKFVFMSWETRDSIPPKHHVTYTSERNFKTFKSLNKLITLNTLQSIKSLSAWSYTEKMILYVLQPTSGNSPHYVIPFDSATLLFDDSGPFGPVVSITFGSSDGQ